jgi:hypothetical protein
MRRSPEDRPDRKLAVDPKQDFASSHMETTWQQWGKPDLINLDRPGKLNGKYTQVKLTCRLKSGIPRMEPMRESLKKTFAAIDTNCVRTSDGS